MIAIVDAGPLYAAADADDPDHSACVAVLQRPDLDLFVPTLVIAEVAYFLEGRLGARAAAEFARSLADLEVEAPLPDDWPIIADLVERYADFPLGVVDASVAVLAERMRTDIIITLDRRHFAALRPGRGAFQLLP